MEKSLTVTAYLIEKLNDIYFLSQILHFIYEIQLCFNYLGKKVNGFAETIMFSWVISWPLMDRSFEQ